MMFFIPKIKNHATLFRFLVQSFLIVFVICLSFAFAKATPVGYEDAKVELSRLMQDRKRSEYRHNWLKLSDDFYDIYVNNANWNNRAAALFRSAIALDEMAKRSFVRKDAQNAIAKYMLLVKKHKLSPLADDSLYRAAQLFNDVLRDEKKAKALLRQVMRDYPTGDYHKKAKIYYAEIGGTAVASLGNIPVQRPSAPSIKLTQISSQLREDVVRIVISMETIASWRAKYSDDENPGVVVTLKNVAPSEKIELEDTFKKTGIFTGYSIYYNEIQATSTVTLQFSDLLRYVVKSEREPARLIIEATNSPKQLPAGILVKDEKVNKKVIAKKVVEKKEKTSQQSKKVANAKNTTKVPERKITKENVPTLTKQLAAQLGLKVETIVIDPGHGGKDPGARHNGMTEKEFNLDIAKRLARVLKSAGYTVYLTRSTDKYLGLYERTDIARKYKADLFISLHANASNNLDAEGLETYFLDFAQDNHSVRIAAIENAGVEKRGLGEMEKILSDMLLTARIQESKRLAAKVQHNAVRKITREGYALKNRGTKGAPFHVLIGSSMPCILIEMGYTTNSKEAARLSSDKYKNALAEGIANGIHQYAEELLK